MLPFLIQNDTVSIAAYPFFYGLGLVVAGVILATLLSRRGYRFRDGVFIWAIVCVLVVLGGRLLYLLIYFSSENLTAGWFFSLNEGGEVLYGAMIVAILGGWSLCRFLGVAATEALDAAAVGTPLGVAVGRVGCLLKGCCHGTRSDSWWSISYPKVIDIYGNLIGSPAYLEQVEARQLDASAIRSLPVQPVPIYESIVCTLLAAAFFVMWRRRWLPGRLMFAFVGIYAIWRFGIEFIRERDEHIIGQLTIYQAISIGLFVVCLAACLFLKPVARSETSERNFWEKSKNSRSRDTRGLP
jgi:phosphatidylglycerol:prolipoprotein diacylglycerol transferase